MKLAMKLVSDMGRPRFDAQKVMSRVWRANVRNLGRAAALVRTIARRSLRRSKRKSNPGEPPRVHSKHPYATLKNIRFQVDGQLQAAIVGPVKFDAAAADSIPQTLEKGGTMKLPGKKQVVIQPRPFMGPAHEIAMKKYPQFWKDSV